jgi:glucose-1-phosphate thymidylyltransferase
LLQASEFIQTIQERQGLMISCPEEIAFRMGFIDRDQLLKLGQELSSNSYGQYILDIAKSSK